MDFLLLHGNDFEMFFPWSLFLKGKEDWHKKANNPSEGVKRRMIACNKESLDVVFVDLNIDILGAPLVCKGVKKINKASRKVMCAKVAKATTFICVDILELARTNFHVESWFRTLLLMTIKLSIFFSRKGLPP